MKDQYTADVRITVSLECCLRDGEPLPDIKTLLDGLLQHPMVKNSLVWQAPIWRQHHYWTSLEDAPFERGDVVIHVCEVDGIGRTLLACIQNDRTIVYLVNAEEEEVERVVYDYMRCTYSSYQNGFYTCPQSLREKYVQGT